MDQKNQSFILSVAKLLAVINSSMWLFNKIIPESLYQLIRKAIDSVVRVIDAYPLQSITAVASFVVITHAFALRKSPPEKWK